MGAWFRRTAAVWILILSVSFLFAQGGAEQDSLFTLEAAPPVTGIDTLIAEALSLNPSIAAIDQKVEALRGEALQAGLPNNPVIGYKSEEVGSGGKAGKQGMAVSQELMTGGKRECAQNAVLFEADTLLFQREAEVFRVSNEVRTLAWHVLAAREMTEVRRRLKTLADQTVQVAGEFRRAGEISEMSFLQLTVQAQEAGIAVQTAENAQISAEQELMVYLRPNRISIGPIAEHLDSILNYVREDEKEYQYSLLSQNPKIREAESVIRQRQAALTLEQARSKPNVTLEGGVFYDTDERETIASAGISMPLRIYDRNQGNLIKARAECGEAVMRAEQAKLEVLRKNARVWQEYKTARSEALVYRDEILPKLRRSYELNAQSFRQGQVSYLEMSSSQTAYFTASGSYIDSLRRLADAVSLLESALVEP